MHQIIYYLAFPIIWLFSKLPFRLLYIISDFIYFLLFYLIRYRKKVVLENLKLAFPNKTNKELIRIQKKFFSHFVDTLIDAIKALTISEKNIKKRFSYTNIELIDKLYKEGKSIILVGAHYGNWEWIIGIPLVNKIDCYTSYTKLQNKNFENLIKTSRSKFGVICLQSTEITKEIHKNFVQKKQGLYLLLSDQSPQLPTCRIDKFGNIEPRIKDLMDDPVTWAIMARDRISRKDLLKIINTAKKARSVTKTRQAA